MTIKDLKRILNKCPNENAEICFCLCDFSTDDCSTDLLFDYTETEPELDLTYINFTLDKTYDPERTKIVLSDMLKHID